MKYPNDYNEQKRMEREFWNELDGVSKIKLELKSILSILVPICLVLLAIWFISTKRRPTNLEIFAEVRPLFEQCQSIEDSRALSRRGHALVLDIDTGGDFTGWHKASYISERTFPRANTFDQRITVFLVSTLQQDFLGNYRVASGFCDMAQYNPGFNTGFSDTCKGAGAYRARYDVCVVYWPERQAVGMKTLISVPPGEVGNAFSGEIVGEPIDVYSWIESLPTLK